MGTRLLCRKAFAGAILLAGVILLPQAVCAQSSTNQDQNLTTSPKGTMFTRAMQWVSQTKRGELLTTLRYRQVYDSNIAASPGNHFSGTYTYVESDWRYSHHSPGRTWQFIYRLGGRFYGPRFSDLNTPSNNLEFQVQQRLTNRLNVSVFQRWARLPSSGFEEPQPGQAVPLMNSDDENVAFLTRKKQTMETALVFQYRADARTSLVWGGNYNDLKYTPTTLLRSRATDVYGSVNHQLTVRQTVGVGYMTQWITYPGQLLDARVDNFLATYSNQLTSTLSVSLFGGPAFVHQTISGGTKVGLFESTRRSFVGGVTVDKKFGHNNLSLKFNRTYARGSALLGTVLRDSVSVNLARHLTQHLTVTVSSAVTHNDLGGNLGGGSTPLTYTSYRLQPSIRYRVGPRVWLTFSQAYARAAGHTALSGLGRNVIMFGIEYKLPDWAVER